MNEGNLRGGRGRRGGDTTVGRMGAARGRRGYDGSNARLENKWKTNDEFEQKEESRVWDDANGQTRTSSFNATTSFNYYDQFRPLSEQA